MRDNLSKVDDSVTKNNIAVETVYENLIGLGNIAADLCD
jgi:hypothetical protein